MVYLIDFVSLDFCLQRVNKSSSEMELKINYSPISLGKLRIWASVHHSLKSMKDLGMTPIMSMSLVNSCDLSDINLHVLVADAA